MKIVEPSNVSSARSYFKTSVDKGVKHRSVPLAFLLAKKLLPVKWKEKYKKRNSQDHNTENMCL